MLRTMFVVLAIVRLLGFRSSRRQGLIHLLVVVALAILVINFLRGRANDGMRRVPGRASLKLDRSVENACPQPCGKGVSLSSVEDRRARKVTVLRGLPKPIRLKCLLVAGDRVAPRVSLFPIHAQDKVNGGHEKVLAVGPDHDGID